MQLARSATARLQAMRAVRAGRPRRLQSMFKATHTAEHGWARGGMQPYGPLSMDPAAQVLSCA